MKLEIGNKRSNSESVWKLRDILLICGGNDGVSEICFKNILVARQRVGKGCGRNKINPELISVKVDNKYVETHYIIPILYISDIFF